MHPSLPAAPRTPSTIADTLGNNSLQGRKASPPTRPFSPPSPRSAADTAPSPGSPRPASYSNPQFASPTRHSSLCTWPSPSSRFPTAQSSCLHGRRSPSYSPTSPGNAKIAGTIPPSRPPTAASPSHTAASQCNSHGLSPPRRTSLRPPPRGLHPCRYHSKSPTHRCSTPMDLRLAPFLFQRDGRLPDWKGPFQ